MKLRTMLTLVADQPPTRQRLALSALLAREDEADFAAFADRAAVAWEADMVPARDALVAALQAGDLDALCSLRASLPALLGEVSKNGALAAALMRQLFRVFAAALGEESGAIRSADAGIPRSLQQWRSREIFPTDFGSADLRGFSSELHLRSVWSARTTNADYLNEVGQTVDQILSGEINVATGRWHLMKKLKQLGYNPETGFPQDMALVPPAERGSLQDLSSEQRIDLMLKTNVQIARNYARVVEGNTDFARFAWPAWKLVRFEMRAVPRGSAESRTAGWIERWQAAGESIGWVGASKDELVALKDSPIWQALADGVGGYEDTLGHPFPPFAFNSGMDWQAVPREKCLELGLLGDGGKHESGKMEAQLAPTKSEVQDAMERIGPEFRDELLKELEELAA